MRRARFQSHHAMIVIVLLVAVTLVAARWNKPPEIPKVSSFAPAADLIEQVDFFLTRVATSLADPADFDLAKQSRTLKDSNTLAALALLLAVHDEEHPLKKAAPAMVDSAQALAAADDNFDRAKAAFDQLKALRDGTANAEAAIRWEKTASLAALMKQVPLIHSGLKRGVEGNRLARQAVQSAGQAAALAAIAQASLLDTEHLKSPEEIAKWSEYCQEMRDAAGEVNSAVHAKDQARVSAGMKRLSLSCDACHATFRQSP